MLPISEPRLFRAGRGRRRELLSCDLRPMLDTVRDIVAGVAGTMSEDLRGRPLHGSGTLHIFWGEGRLTVPVILTRLERVDRQRPRLLPGAKAEYWIEAIYSFESAGVPVHNGALPMNVLPRPRRRAPEPAAEPLELDALKQLLQGAGDGASVRFTSEGGFEVLPSEN